MNSPTVPEKKSASRKRRYNSPLRKQQSADTRDRIVLAGVDLVQGFPTWDWTNLTAKAVSEVAGVSERTVYRHFATERNLRDAVMQRLVADSGIDLGNLRMEDFAATTEHMFQYLAAFSTRVRIEQDPTFVSIDEHRRLALLHSVQRSMKDASAEKQNEVAAILNMFWDPHNYERLISDWNLSPEYASQLIGKMIGDFLQSLDAHKQP